MRISAKGRYALAAAVEMAKDTGGEYITLSCISDRLGISKIYLEQVFSLLKRAGLVLSTKGAQGGYKLACTPGEITALDILLAAEQALAEPAQETVPEKAPALEAALRALVFDKLDMAIGAALGAVTIADLVAEAKKLEGGAGPMFYI